MQRIALIERLRRQAYGEFPSDDASITDNLINVWMSDGIALAAKQNYKDNIAIEGIGFLNNSFYTTFKGIAVTKDENFTWKITLPEIPIGIGRTEGIETLKFKSSTGEVGIPAIPISSSQASFFEAMRPIPNKILYKPESNYVIALSTVLLSQYTATVTMVSGGDGADLTSSLNVPNDYINVIVEYVKAQVAFERAQPQDVANDGRDAK